mmetsp:Transcript_36961/g.77217  ORF Transcript_36961/g.77217 Transcript_36961/m.77217 type:complete len:118 (-) Transcript_36961:580-933(-)
MTSSPWQPPVEAQSVDCVQSISKMKLPNTGWLGLDGSNQQLLLKKQGKTTTQKQCFDAAQDSQASGFTRCEESPPLPYVFFHKRNCHASAPFMLVDEPVTLMRIHHVIQVRIYDLPS